MSKLIKLSPNQVKDFVSAATKCDFDVDISYNRFTVDAKSILGVFGLDFRQPLKVSYRGFNEDFENYLAEHSVAC
ncbi:HPr family phosphocarrier protein [Butyrivibrio sp. AE3006]|uniref:HPr family phosphocarrier protein n=1 Tax=Butyrivibrio sp. AE3006 TaxID=1280673 RepID=UPI0003FB593B|nr:HPr family phosphocarrier protein [Butyrivibrio sp. AE3006]